SLYYFVIFDAVVVSIVVTLDMFRIVPLYPFGLVGIAALFASNVLILWRSNRRPEYSRVKTGRVLKWLWLGVAAYTTATIAMIVSWIREPNIKSASQIIIGIALAGYLWFLADRYRQKRNGSDAPK
ncbi:MAG TPA: hypothetical protein VFE02_05790, partial [Candidatus Acidoferrales bacterium]|nr:hypothetical protein [Candidatus Acidoferrales bacterium]